MSIAIEELALMMHFDAIKFGIKVNRMIGLMVKNFISKEGFF